MPQGMIATSHPLAVQQGAAVLESGGNAVDAAIAAAAVLCVVEPMSVSPGGDLFAMVWEPGSVRPAGLAAAGWAGSRAGSTELDGGTLDGAPAVTVPGAIAGWDQLLDRYGSFDRARILVPAIRAANEGFEVTASIAQMWAQGAARLGAEAASVYLIDGRAPGAGERMSNRVLGSFLETLAEQGFDRFYEERIATRIVEALGPQGVLTAADITEWIGPEWVDPLSGRYRDLDIFEMPPPGQGLAVLQAVAMYESLDVPDRDRQHALIECMKVALEDAGHYVCDPNFGSDAATIMLDPEHIEKRSGEVSPESARSTPPPGGSDTVFIAAVDEDGMACSLIQSIYMHFGSGIVLPETGVLLHNRGANFRVDPSHPNRPESRKRPLHTILPVMIGVDDAFHASFGVVGAFMQPQGQLQILHHLSEGGASPTEALGSPRWRILGHRRLGVEDGFDSEAVEKLVEKGHEVESLPPLEAGGAQLIARAGEGLLGASEPRRDGHAQDV